MAWKLPVGIDDFREIRDGDYYFVDKTDFIGQLIDGHSKVTLLTRPRRFGKTLTMSMLEWFFSVEKASLSESLFQDLHIGRAGEGCWQERGRYPVIFLTLKGVLGDNWETLYQSFCLLIQREYMRHDYLLDGALLKPSEKDYYRRILDLSASPADFQVSLLYLSQYLHRYYQQPAVILIDEYDAPVQCAYDHGFYEKAILFIRAWFNNALKTNPSLAFAVLTGVLRIAKESIFSGLNNLEVCSVLSDHYSQAMGFTADEVRKMAVDFGAENKLPEVTYWYDGYRIGRNEIYNPWSVINYFANHCLPQPYWVNTSGNSILQVLLQRADRSRIKSLQSLLSDKTVNVTLNEGVVYADIGSDKSALYTILLMTGYLTPDGECRSAYNRYALRIPNQEVKQVYRTEILNQLVSGLDRDDFDDLFDALFSGDEETFREELQDIVDHVVSVYDTANRESFYHGFMLGMTALFLGKEYYVESNRESGYGRFDLAIFPREKEKAGVIMEFKVAEKETYLPVKAAEALQQIEEKQYLAAFQQRKIKTVWKYGIAFCGKKIYVEEGT